MQPVDRTEQGEGGQPGIDVAGMVGGRIVYVRATAPEELLGGAMRLFAREEPSLPRMRSAVR